MLSNKPYLIRAFYQWIVDSACTPYLVVNADYPGCYVPTEYIENGQITLNVSPSAVRDMNMANDLIEFKASFAGVVYMISVPVKAVLGIYASENQQGMFFDYEDILEGEGENASNEISSGFPLATEKGENKTQDKSKPYLRIVD
ncbi:MAG: sspB [Gammaproteobacteria bacterium]|jgi:stringent starvation protein B|nr:sspB [Gammaproteobacteria bacterium]